MNDISQGVLADCPIAINVNRYAVMRLFELTEVFWRYAGHDIAAIHESPILHLIQGGYESSVTNPGTTERVKEIRSSDTGQQGSHRGA
jgi:hypothetical protein